MYILYKWLFYQHWRKDPTWQAMLKEDQLRQEYCLGVSAVEFCYNIETSEVEEPYLITKLMYD